jgi:hypothetical protein
VGAVAYRDLARLCYPQTPEEKSFESKTLKNVYKLIILLSVGIAKAHPGSPHYFYHKARDTVVATDLKTLAGSSFVDSLHIK